MYGAETYQNCPFGNGNGYGDGRAMSLGELVTDGTQARHEMQLKGAGPTPFSRGADGRAVLRSSIREFLASEAMHNLGVPTTRALSLVRSGSETARRPWYSDVGPRRGSEPNTVVAEPCAITCRVAPSFLRVGHVELFGRRARAGAGGEAASLDELRLIVKHAIFREFPGIADFGPGSTEELQQEHVVELLRQASHGIASLTANWIRVGFVQGNFNSVRIVNGSTSPEWGSLRFRPLICT